MIQIRYIHKSSTQNYCTIVQIVAAIQGCGVRSKVVPAFYGAKHSEVGWTGKDKMERMLYPPLSPRREAPELQMEAFDG